MRADGSKSKYVQYDFPAVSLSAQAVPSPGGGSEHTYSKSALVTRATGQRSSSEILETLFGQEKAAPTRSFIQILPFQKARL